MRHFFFRALLAAFLGWLAGAAPAATGLAPADVTAMKKVIESQLEAFRRDDEIKAFSHASPGIQERFGTAQTFIKMVRQQYGAVYRPASISFLKPQSDGGMIIYPVRVTDHHGRVWMALYTMQQHGRTWKISGCQLVASAALSI